MKSTTPSAPALIQNVLTAAQNGVMVYLPERDSTGALVDFRLVMLNSMAEREMTRPAHELIGQRFTQLYPHLKETSLLEQYRQVMETGEAAHVEFQCTRPGQPQPAWFAISVMRLEGNLVVSFQDVTQAKADTKAAQQAYWLEKAFEASIHGVAVYKAVRNERGVIDDFQLVMINEAGLRMSGHTHEQVIGKSVWQIYPATRINGLFDRKVQVCETGQPYSGEHYYPEYDIWIELSIVPVERGVMLTYVDITARKTTELATLKQTQLFETILESVTVGIAVLSPVYNQAEGQNRATNFRVVRMNNGLRRMLNLSASDSYGHYLTTVFQAAGRSELLSSCITAFEQGQQQEYDLPYLTDGSTRWYRVSIVCQDSQLILTLTDVSATKEAQQVHSTQAQLLQKISDNTPAGLVLWEAVRDDTPQRNVIDFRYRMTNLMNALVTGYADSDLAGNHLLELFPRFRGTELEYCLREVIETGRTQRMIFTYYNERPGAWFDAQFVRHGDGVLMTFMDVSEGYKAQLIQKAQYDLFQTVINRQPAGIVLYGVVREPTQEGQPGPIVDFVFELANKAELELVGRSANELIGKRLRTLFPSHDGQQLFEKMVSVAETGQGQEWLLPYFSDGIQGWFQASLVPHGEQILFTFLDVTELKRQQQALEVANMELSHSNDNLQQFAYIASHDLQEPLRKIQAFGDIIATRNAHVLDDSTKDMLTRMQDSATRMSWLIKDLLEYSRITTHRRPFSPVHLSDLLNEVLGDLFVVVHESKARVTWDPLPMIVGDKNQLYQLFQNLLSNAIKFRPEGVSPQVHLTARTVSIREMPPALIEKSLAILTMDDGSDLQFHEISVADNGIGFEEHYLDRIFQVFQRLHGRGKYPGTGIGLAICRKVIETHRGLLTATSQPGKGSTFRVYLPVGEPISKDKLHLA
ncbi:PAS domain-containing protein [Spirosoma sp. 209]|uniref:PAS domain-containing protein n=1 Tax=Spirosoma sp. 209 TaxID=1955701 RepID=UPI00098CFBBD|nr:PAS domain-containing protein [Spirosoma sp. 209]